MATEVEELKAELKRLNAMLTEISEIATGGITEATNAVAGQVLGLRRFYEGNRTAIDDVEKRKEILRKELVNARETIHILRKNERAYAKRNARVNALLKSTKSILTVIRKEMR